MQLYARGTSPYARKVRIALIELGLADTVELVGTSPTESPAYRAINPLGKIPALRRDDGVVLYDSLVIVDWLDQTYGTGTLIPHEPELRTAELHRHALANGIIDAAFSATMEARRPDGERSEFWIGRWNDAVLAGAEALVDNLPATLTLSAITAVCAVDYVAFRLGHIDLGALAAWRQALGPHASLDTTLPHLELA